MRETFRLGRSPAVGAALRVGGIVKFSPQPHRVKVVWRDLRIAADLHHFDPISFSQSSLSSSL